MKNDFIKEFSTIYDLVLRLRTEIVGANSHLVDADLFLFLNQHQKYMVTFKALKEGMSDLERAVNRVSETASFQKFSYEIEK